MMALAAGELQARAGLLLVIAMVITLPIALKAMRRTLDPLEPLVMTSIAFFVLFVIRPLYDISHGGPTYLNYDIERTYDLALEAVLVAVIAFEIGYAGGRLPVSLAASLRRRLGVGRPLPDFAILVSALILTAVGAGATVLNAVLAGGVDVLFQNRDAVVTGSTNVPVIAVAESLAVPCLLLLWCVPGSTKNLSRILAVLPVVVLGIAAVPKGDRRLLLPLFAAIGSSYYLRRGRRPRWVAMAVVTFAILFLVVTPLRSSRNGSTSFVDAAWSAIQDPAAALEALFIEQDTSQVNVLAVLVAQVGDHAPIPWQGGMATLTETLLQPIPRQVWPGKPEPIRTQFIVYNFGMLDGRCISQCPTLSIVGTFYADFGLAGVAFGCLLLGLLSKAWYLIMMSMRADPIVIAAYSGMLFTFFLIWWSSLSTLVSDFGVYALPVLAVGALARARRPGRMLAGRSSTGSTVA